MLFLKNFIKCLCTCKCMKIGVVGTGYVGLVTGTCFADLGNEVICYDIDTNKIKSLNKAKVHFYEPGLRELVERNLHLKRLFFTNDSESLFEADIIFICVGTPMKFNGEADLSQVESVAELLKGIKKDTLIVIKSTVPVGTCKHVKRIIKGSVKDVWFDVASNPEFLREGAAVKDFQVPDRIVIGVEQKKSEDLLKNLYKPLSRTDKPIITTDTKTSELIKYASNAMLATRISFMNELSNLTSDLGADIKTVAKAMGLDDRIGPRFLQAGAGYGGSCFPKDVRALSHMIEQRGHPSPLLKAVDYINERQKMSVVQKLKAFMDLDGKKVAIWGLSFKPKTDDIREAVSHTVVSDLLKEYARVSVYDPEAMPNFKKQHKNIEYAASSYEAVKDADALILLTEWDEFRSPDFERVRKLMKDHVLVDGRNIYNPDSLKKQGFKYIGMGR